MSQPTRMTAWQSIITPLLMREDVATFDIKLTDDYALVILIKKDNGIDHFSFIYRDDQWHPFAPLHFRDPRVEYYVHLLTDLQWTQTIIALYIGISQSSVSKVQMARKVGIKPKQPEQQGKGLEQLTKTKRRTPKNSNLLNLIGRNQVVAASTLYLKKG